MMRPRAGSAVGFALLPCLFIACSSPGEQATASGRASAGASTAAPQPAVATYEVVRIDPASFLETRLGRVKFDKEPPFQGAVLEGEQALRTLIDEVNGLDHVMSAGLIDNPGSKVVRSEPQFFRIMRFGWLKSTHHVALRDPVPASRPSSRWSVFQREQERYRLLGTVELDGNDYLHVLGGPDTERNALGKLSIEVNERYGFSMQLPPPPGEEGKWGRVVQRGTEEHRAHVRDRLLRDGFVLLPEGGNVPEQFFVVQRSSSASNGPWLSVDVSSGFTEIPETPEVPLHLAGPPGGPSELKVSRYKNLRYDAASLTAHVAAIRGKETGFSLGPTRDVELAGRKLLGATFETGSGPPASRAHVVVMWPRIAGPEQDAPRTEDGVLVEVTVTAGEKDPQKLVDHPSVNPVLQSLFIDLEPSW